MQSDHKFCTTLMVFTGRFQPQSFADFVSERAARLALTATIGTLAPDRIAVTVSGQAGLVDAFEMACSLGPRDCLVLDVERYPHDAPEATG